MGAARLSVGEGHGPISADAAMDLRSGGPDGTNLHPEDDERDDGNQHRAMVAARPPQGKSARSWTHAPPSIQQEPAPTWLPCARSTRTVAPLLDSVLMAPVVGRISGYAREPHRAGRRTFTVSAAAAGAPAILRGSTSSRRVSSGPRRNAMRGPVRILDRPLQQRGPQAGQARDVRLEILRVEAEVLEPVVRGSRRPSPAVRRCGRQRC